MVAKPTPHGQKPAALVVVLVLLFGGTIAGGATAQDRGNKLGVYIGLAAGVKYSRSSAPSYQLANQLSAYIAGELRRPKTLAGIESIKGTDLELPDDHVFGLVDSELISFFGNQKVLTYLRRKGISHMLVGTIEASTSLGQMLQWRLARLNYDDMSESQIYPTGEYFSQEAQLSKSDIKQATKKIISYLVAESPSIGRTNKVIASCFIFMGDAEKKHLRNYILTLPSEITSKISHSNNESEEGLVDKGYEVLRFEAKILFSRCAGDGGQAGELSDLAWEKHSVEYVISGFGLDLESDFWLHLQIVKPRLEIEPYHSDHTEKMDSYRRMGEKLATHILTEWDNITSTLEKGPKQ